MAAKYMKIQDKHVLVLDELELDLIHFLSGEIMGTGDIREAGNIIWGTLSNIRPNGENNLDGKLDALLRTITEDEK